MQYCFFTYRLVTHGAMGGETLRLLHTYVPQRKVASFRPTAKSIWRRCDRTLTTTVVWAFDAFDVTSYGLRLF
jgi:hypothetical protein